MPAPTLAHEDLDQVLFTGACTYAAWRILILRSSTT